MSESEAIGRSAAGPITADSLASDLGRLGVAAGQTVLVHSSLSSLGWVCGGGVAVVEALLSVLGTEGTLVVPTHTADCSDPAAWVNPPVPEFWRDTIRNQMPAFHPAATPSRGMGAVPEVVRSWPGARRSQHPQVSFAAVGPAADVVTSGYQLADGMGERSPLARLYDLGALVLLIGVGHDRNSSLHLAQYRCARLPRVEQSGPVLVEGERRWLTWDDLDLDTAGFPALGAHLDDSGATQLGAVGQAEARLMSQRRIVDDAAGWFAR